METMTWILIALLILQMWGNLHRMFKIAYYEAKLESQGVDISKVKNMPFYRLWIV